MTATHHDHLSTAGRNTIAQTAIAACERSDLADRAGDVYSHAIESIAGHRNASGDASRNQMATYTPAYIVRRSILAVLRQDASAARDERSHEHQAGDSADYIESPDYITIDRVFLAIEVHRTVCDCIDTARILANQDRITAARDRATARPLRQLAPNAGHRWTPPTPANPAPLAVHMLRNSLSAVLA